jgi:hypothetical protein
VRSSCLSHLKAVWCPRYGGLAGFRLEECGLGVKVSRAARSRDLGGEPAARLKESSCRYDATEASDKLASIHREVCKVRKQHCLVRVLA